MMNSGKLVSRHLVDQLELSNKQNNHTELNTSITKAKQFSSNSINSIDPKHKSTYVKKHTQTNSNLTQTVFQTRNSNIISKTSKINDIYIHQQIINKQPKKHLQTQKQTQQQQKSKKQSLRIINNNHNNYNQSNQSPIKVQKQHQSIKKTQQELINQQNKNNPSKRLSQLNKYKQKHKLPQIKRQTQKPIVKQQLQSVKFKQLHTHDQLEITKNDLITTPNIFQSCSHIMNSIKLNYSIDHIFNKHYSCAFSQPILFNLPTKTAQSISSQKISRFSSSQFKIYLNKKGQMHQLATLKSNFIGSIYNFYPKGIDAIYFSIIFQSKKGQNSQSFRYCQIFINQNLISGQNKHLIIPYNKMQSLEGLYLLNKVQERGSYGQIIKLHSRLPTWSQSKECFALKFTQAEGILPSVKNTILVNQEDKQVLQFYKNSYLTYNLTFENPISWIVAYGYALASTDFKLATE